MLYNEIKKKRKNERERERETKKIKEDLIQIGSGQNYG
jgi:hypothetical protein